MSNRDIVRAWKDEGYRNSLSEAQRAGLPENPAGAIELPDDELMDAAGGSTDPIGCGIVISVTISATVASVRACESLTIRCC